MTKRLTTILLALLIAVFTSCTGGGPPDHDERFEHYSGMHPTKIDVDYLNDTVFLSNSEGTITREYSILSPTKITLRKLEVRRDYCWSKPYDLGVDWIFLGLSEEEFADYQKECESQESEARSRCYKGFKKRSVNNKQRNYWLIPAEVSDYQDFANHHLHNIGEIVTVKGYELELTSQTNDLRQRQFANFNRGTTILVTDLSYEHTDRCYGK